MKLEFSERFIAAYDELQPEVQVLVDKALRLLMTDPRHPSLRLKKMHGKAAVWEARVDRSYRLTLEIRDDSFLLRTVGKHLHEAVVNRQAGAQPKRRPPRSPRRPLGGRSPGSRA